MAQQQNRFTFKAAWCAALIALTGCSPSVDVAPVAAKPEVTVVKVEAVDVPVVYEIVGKTSSSRRVEIRSRVEGFLERRIYREGSRVEEGEVLFLMDRKPFQAQLDAAKAELEQQQARLNNATANLKRVKPLARQNAVAQKELDDALGVFRSSAASVEAAKAKVVQAELNLGYTEIKSPVTGVSSFAVKQEGSYISNSDSLLTYVAQIEPIWVEFSLSENQTFRFRRQLREGTVLAPVDDNFEVEIVLADGTIFPEKGRITFSDASISEKTGTFLLRAEIANPNGLLRPGQFVRTRLLGAIRPKAILVPQRAVQQGAQGSFVWLVDDSGSSRFQPVEVGAWQGDKWFITKGLRGGETVVVDGALKVRPGIALQTTPYAEAASAAVN